MIKQETFELQRKLAALGHYTGPIDGIFGPLTAAAYERYWSARHVEIEVPVLSPSPSKPWWRTGRMKGLVVAALGAAALFIPALREVDTAYLVDLIWENLDHVEQIITALGALAAVAGSIWSTIGAARAKAPVDPTLVARIGGHDLRLPGREPDRMRGNELSTRGQSKADSRDPFGDFGE